MLTDNCPMPFGKYEGRPMEEVPARYLLWLADEMGRKPAKLPQLMVRVYVDANRASLEMEASDD